MGVMSCSRLNCSSIMCDTHIDSVGYVCPECQNEFENYAKGKGLFCVRPDSMIYWSKFKDKVASTIVPGGCCISFGWNSMGLGINRGFEKVEILLVPHGGSRNDTIVTVERKIS